MIVDCQTNQKRWIEISTEFIAGDGGFSSIGEWLVTSIAELSSEDSCIHVQAIVLTDEEYDGLETEALLGNYGSSRVN
jgi:hypothetical protein